MDITAKYLTPKSQTLWVYSRWREIGERREIEEKMFEKAQFTLVNEHFEAIFDKDISSAAI